MCVYSMIMDHYADKWFKYVQQRPPWVTPNVMQPMPQFDPPPAPISPIVPGVPAISPAEIEEFRKLLDRAREYDKRNNEPDCELQEKKDRIKKIADELGVKIDFL